MAARAEALDRSDPGHHEATAPRGKQWRSVNPTDAGRSARDRQHRVEDQRAGGSLPRTPESPGRPVTGRPGNYCCDRLRYHACVLTPMLAERALAEPPPGALRGESIPSAGIG